MTDALRAKIESETDEATWEALAVHAARGGLFLVDSSIGLASAALAIATNRAPLVAYWIEADLLVRPSAEDVAALEAEPTRARFRVAIVQPHVLAERVTD